MKRKVLVQAGQFAVGAALIAYLIGTMENKAHLLHALRTAASQWPWLIAGNLLFGVCLLLVIARWHLLLRSQELVLPFRRTLTLYFIGQFFNAFMLGATGGDLVKAYYAAKETHHRKTEAVTTVFLDRVIGLVTLVGIIVVVLLARIRLVRAHPETRVALVFFACVCATAVTAIAASAWRNLFDHVGFLRRLRERTRLGAMLNRIYTTFQIGFRRPAVMLSTIGLSLLNHVLNVASAMLLGRALNLRLPFADWLTAIPVINAVSAIPITPGGLGTREATATVMLNHVFQVPIENALLLSLLIYASTLVWSLVGGAVYMLSDLKRRPPPPDLSDATV